MPFQEETVTTAAGDYLIELYEDEEDYGASRYDYPCCYYLAYRPNSSEPFDSLYGIGDMNNAAECIAYALDTARQAIAHDAAERVTQANTAGAGIVGII